MGMYFLALPFGGVFKISLTGSGSTKESYGPSIAQYSALWSEYCAILRP